MKKFIYILIMVIITISFTGCTLIDSSMIKLGLKNNDFEYLKDSDLEEIIIQSARDPGFRFIVTDKNAINDIYNILSKGSIKQGRSSLDPDYVFEIHQGNDIKYYNYVVSSNEKGVGNFYNDDTSYEISKNLDQTIIDNLSFIRKPKNFELVYYQCILDVLNAEKGNLTSGDNKVGVDISGDIDCLKYVFSVDLLQFGSDLNNLIPGAQLVKNNAQDFNTVVTVKNKGYSTKIFKSTITVDNKVDNSYKTYYVQANYELKSWTIKVSDANKVPDNW